MHDFYACTIHSDYLTMLCPTCLSGNFTLKVADYPKYTNTMRRPDIALFFQIIPNGMHHNGSNNPYSIKEEYGYIRPLGNVPITGKHYCGNIEEQERHNHKGELS
jgi:hypothetical protein